MRAISAIVLLVTLAGFKAAAIAAEPCDYDPRKLRPIMASHTVPPISFESRLAMSGTVRLLLTISPDGKVTNASVEKSSDWERLDVLAREYVKAKWQWRPWRGHCARTRVAVGFEVP